MAKKLLALSTLLLLALSCFGQIKVNPNGGGIKIGPTVKIVGVAAAGGSATFDAFSSSGITVPSGGQTVTVSHTCSATTPALVVFVYYGTTTHTVTGITYNGVAMSSAGSVTNIFKEFLYTLVAPASGANNIVVTTDSNQNEDILVVGISATGASQTAPFGTAVTASANDGTATLNVSSAANQLVVDGIGVLIGDVTAVGGGETQRVHVASNTNVAFSSSTATGSGTTAMSGTLDTSRFWTQIGIAISP